MRPSPKPNSASRVQTTPPTPRLWLWGVAGVGLILLPLLWVVL